MNEKHPAIQIQGLTKTFRIGLRRKRTEALRGLDLEVQAGEIFGFLGPNGAGKTTTIKILVGLLKSDQGQAQIFGESIKDAASRARLAYMPELPDFYDYLKPSEFLLHMGNLAGLDRSTSRRRIPELLDRVGLNPDEKRPMRKFSKGMLQRVGLAQTMIGDPDLYILDEPMGGLDPMGRRAVKDLIHDLGSRGKTVFFSSHVLAEAEAVCHRVALMREGKLIRQGELNELLTDKHAPFEILLEGLAAQEDQVLAKKCQSVSPAGKDSLLFLNEGQRPEELMGWLKDNGYRLHGINRRQTSLEDVFIRTMQDEAEGN